MRWGLQFSCSYKRDHHILDGSHHTFFYTRTQKKVHFSRLEPLFLTSASSWCFLHVFRISAWESCLSHPTAPRKPRHLRATHPLRSSKPSTSYKWIAMNLSPQNLLQWPQCDCQTVWDASLPTAQQNHTSLSDRRTKLWSFSNRRTKQNSNHYETMVGMISLSHVHIHILHFQKISQSGNPQWFWKNHM